MTVGAPVAAPGIAPSAAAQPVAYPLAMTGRAADIAGLDQRRVDICGCPHCDSRDVVRWGSAGEMPGYRCKACKCSCNALAKTPLARHRRKDEVTRFGGASHTFLGDFSHGQNRFALFAGIPLPDI
jgi:hypothetical protein